MRSFLLLYNGPPPGPGASHEGWPEWFHNLGSRLVDKGSPMTAGFAVRADGTTSGHVTSLNGYSIIRAEDEDEVRDLVGNHPFLAARSEHTVEVFEVPAI
jgi:hypothetical protein